MTLINIKTEQLEGTIPKLSELKVKIKVKQSR